ncbi:MAG TPA: carboxypeptidase-like regulatory domain-containing protein [Polyangia bacterium]
MEIAPVRRRVLSRVGLWALVVGVAGAAACGSPEAGDPQQIAGTGGAGGAANLPPDGGTAGRAGSGQGGESGQMGTADAGSPGVDASVGDDTSPTQPMPATDAHAADDTSGAHDAGAKGDDAGDAGPSPDGAPPAVSIPAGTVTGTLKGMGGQPATVLLGNEAHLFTQSVSAGGTYKFEKVPAGTYFLKVQASGMAAGPARQVRVTNTTTLFLAANDAPVAATSGPIDFQLAPLPSNVFHYRWEEDPSPAGYEETANVVAPPKIEFLDEKVTLPDLAAAETLRAQYNVILSNEGQPWSQEHAYRLLESLRAIPQPVRKNEGEVALKPSKWVLTDQRLEDDANFVFGAAGNQVTLSRDVFVYASPRLVMIDGQRARFFSKRLHHALVRYVTRNGNDHAAAEKILQERFGCSTVIPDYPALTAPTTKEQPGSFQAFHPNELVKIINTFEEMPDGYHKVKGLKYLVRRKDGMPHPWYVQAPAVAWALPEAFPNGSYIEFMDSAFTANPDDTHRLILHEKSHFLWGYIFSQKLRDDWAKVGGWYENPADPDGWSTTKTTEFVSAYAHKKNPNEDMAESIAFFVLNPAGLQSRSAAKFEFIRDRVMQGTRYLSKIQDDLTFEVLNLFPDYQYPGKIRRVDITAEGAPNEDKTVKIEIELHTANKVFAGASLAYLRLYSPINTFEDVYLYPTDTTGAVLRGQVKLSKYAKAGAWRPDQIVVTDKLGNQRLEGVNDYGWKLIIDNPLEDVEKPVYVNGSLTVQRSAAVIVEDGVSHPVERVEVRWRYVENRVMQRVYAKLANAAAINVYPLEAYGSFDAATSTALVVFNVTPHMTTGEYGVPYIAMTDAANNPGSQNFSSSPQHQPLVSVPITTTDPDTEAPHVALNDDTAMGLHKIRISAQPTNPERPNGETLVVIQYQARDDKAGLGVVSYRLLDPQGISHHQYHYHPNFHTQFFKGNPSAWTEYEIRVVLPVGSPPGKWGLQEWVARDKAGNQRTHNFVETLHFVVAN